MSGERFWLSTPGGRIALPGTLRPNVLRPTARSPNLVRARGYRQTYDLSDNLPDPVPVTLTGEVEYRTEEELSRALAELRRDLRAATAIDRDGREPYELLSASVLAVPSEGDNSARATLTVTLILSEVPDPDEDSTFFW